MKGVEINYKKSERRGKRMNERRRNIRESEKEGKR